MQRNNVRADLLAGAPILAITNSFPHADIAEYLAGLGYRLIIVDGEHGPVEDGEVESFARACDLEGAASMVRLAYNDALIQRYLGMGISGIHIPQVQSVSTAQMVIDAAKFSPAGKRGTGNFRASRFGALPSGWAPFMARANEETIVKIAIEDADGLAALPQILELAYIDVVIIGTGDLANSFGLPGQLNHQRVLDATDRAIAQIRKAGKVAGLPASTPSQIQESYRRGARYLLTSVAGMMLVGATAQLDAIAECAAARRE